ncbi:MAG: HAD-IB family hydrolase [Steroidobacteraceae bacterium]
MFDLDGTITRRDTLLPYVWGFLRYHPARAAALLRVLPALARYALRRTDAGGLKSSLIRTTLGGCTRADIDAWTARFVPRLMAHGLSGGALAAITAHREAGDCLVLMSASVDLYVPAIGRALDFEQVLCTAVQWRGEHLDGALAGVNCRGAEKARRLGQLRAQHPGVEIIAYGNAASDLGHLCLADRGVLVNGAWRTRRAAAHLGIACLTWR